MSKKVFDKIMDGLKHALADAMGEPGHVTRVTTIVEPDDAVEHLRTKLKGLRVAPFSAGVSQADDPAAFAAAINEGLRNFENGEHGGGVVAGGGKVTRIKAGDA